MTILLSLTAALALVQAAPVAETETDVAAEAIMSDTPSTQDVDHASESEDVLGDDWTCDSDGDEPPDPTLCPDGPET